MRQGELLQLLEPMRELNPHWASFEQDPMQFVFEDETDNSEEEFQHQALPVCQEGHVDRYVRSIQTSGPSRLVSISVLCGPHLSDTRSKYHTNMPRQRTTRRGATRYADRRIFDVLARPLLREVSLDRRLPTGAA